MKALASLAAGFVLVLSAGCTQPAGGPTATVEVTDTVQVTVAPPETDPHPEVESTAAPSEFVELEFELASVDGIELTTFELPDCEIINNIGAAVPCPMAGQIALPTTPGPHPLAVLLHGVREITDVRTDETYQGFDYLLPQLAAQGFVAVSINIAVDYTFDYGESANYGWATKIFTEHLDRLAAANAGEDIGYGIDLTGKIDLDTIHLIGHSRGAQIADMLARIDHGQEPFPGASDAFPATARIKSVTTLGFVEAIGLAGYPANVPYGILVAEKDEDAHFNDGERLFELAESDPTRSAPATMVILADANHAYFNRAFPNRVPDAVVLDREVQEDFATHFVAAFLASVAGHDSEPNALAMCLDAPLAAGAVRTIFGQRARLDCLPPADWAN